MKSKRLRDTFALVIVSAICLGALYTRPAAAQNTVTFDLDLTDLLAPQLTWSTSPAATVCTASGNWSGTKSGSGNEGVPPIRTSAVFMLMCSWANESIATLTWVNPTTNTDDSPYDHSTGTTRVVWTDQANLSTYDCLAPEQMPPGLQTALTPGTQTGYTVMGLTPGDWDFGVFAVSSIGLCSAMSNTAEKTISPTVDVNDSISITVPRPISGLGAN